MTQQQHEQQHHQKHEQHQRRTRRGGVALVAAAAKFFFFFFFSASRVVVATAAPDENTIAAASASAPSFFLGPVFISDEADADSRVDVSEEEQILARGALESLMQVLDKEGDAAAATAVGDSDARLRATIEGTQVAAAAATPVCSSVKSCLALCPKTNLLVAGAGGATEGSVKELVSVLFLF